MHPSHESYFILRTRLNIYIYPSELIEKNFERLNWVICATAKKKLGVHVYSKEGSLKDTPTFAILEAPVPK